MLRKFLREPLVHFVILSLLLFVIFNALNPEEEEGDSVVVVSDGRVAQLRNDFATRNNREPSQQELEIAMESYALNEMYMREARAMGLDMNDRVVNRRLRQKMEYLMEDMASLIEPSQTDLQDYYQQNQSKYIKQGLLSFEQVFVSVDRDPEVVKEILAEQSALIANGQEPSGDPTMLAREFSRKSARQLDYEFGNGFADKLSTFQAGEWSGPITSSFGQHFILIKGRESEEVLPFEAVQKRVLADWTYDNVQNYKQAYESELKTRYEIKIESTEEAHQGAD